MSREFTLEDMQILLSLAAKNLSELDFTLFNGTTPFLRKSFFDADIGFKVALVVAVFGCIAVLLNVIIIAVLLLHRRSLLKHVFYILLMNFAICDTIRGACLVTVTTFLLKPKSAHIGTGSAMIVNSSAYLILQFCSLIIIFNLLFITLNEYVFVCWPFQYSKLIRNTRVLFAIGCCWILSASFVILATFARHHQSGILILGNANVTDTLNGDVNSSAVTDLRSLLKRDARGEDLESVFNFTLLGFCFLCLAVIIVSYTSFFRVVRRIQRDDERLQRESMNVNTGRFNLSSENIRESDAVSQPISAAAVDRKVRHQVLRRHKYAIVIGLVIAIYGLYLFSYSASQVLVILMQRSNPEETQIILRWSAKVIFGLHAVLQPLCYLRVREFRTSIMKTFCSKAYIRRRRHEEMIQTILICPDQHNLNSFCAVSHLNDSMDAGHCGSRVILLDNARKHAETSESLDLNIVQALVHCSSMVNFVNCELSSPDTKISSDSLIAF